MSPPLKWKLLIGFTLVFIAGLAAGGFVGAMQSRKHWLDFGHRRSLTERVRNRMQARLDLTPAQVAKTSAIFDKTARELEKIRVETGQRVHDALADADRQLAPELTTEQRAKMEALEDQHDPKWVERNALRKHKDGLRP